MKELVKDLLYQKHLWVKLGLPIVQKLLKAYAISET